MKQKGLVLALALILGAGGSVFAQVTVNGGVTYTSVGGGGGWGTNFSMDYLLPISVPLSVGGEIGYMAFNITAAIPLLVRVAYHFDWFSRLDLYAVGKLGYAVSTDTDGGFAFGIDAGTSIYFSAKFGLFLEAGFDMYTVANTAVDRLFIVGLSWKK